ncbi:cytochrome b6-f complex subunit PetL [Brunnivagina elsteri]|uniref:Cytochrome B6 n=1 Tax=Brunnivagina elsteri CCALA 953 TaxID=987040 RepID=A0A2A2TG01_9CYAN|nr:cytochrome b6-f complex subunit PetL [Calothrix elsteri]NJL64082.1 cytochrome b6-f complex subunit PetL [Candidatus Methylacidiphilales bacterium]NJR14995.1 cytochrome b6-f complex subunit PetL [Calothrix sp. CSU_2_0]PAX52670.1 cytochrome B6 [Calothrix elsteri CCALA 953]
MGIVFFALYLGAFFGLAVGLLFGLRAIKLI